jgi:hypothetical protein
MRSEVAGADERRAERLRHVAQRLKYGSSTVTRMTAVKRVTHVASTSTAVGRRLT